MSRQKIMARKRKITTSYESSSRSSCHVQKGAKPTTWFSGVRPKCDCQGRPDWLPELFLGDIIKGAMQHDGRACLQGWLNHCYSREGPHGFRNIGPKGKMADLLSKEARKLGRKLVASGQLAAQDLELLDKNNNHMPYINDGQIFTFQEVADIWNAAVAKNSDYHTFE